MMYRHISLLVLVGMFLVTPFPGGQAHAREIVLCTMNWEPYYGKDLPRGGFFTDIVRTAFERAGHTVNVEFMPWPRAMLEVKQGDRDVLLGAYYSDERARTYVASKPIYTDKTGLVALNSLGFQDFDSLHELSDYTIGVGRGFAVSEEFDSADYLDKEFEKTQVLNLRKLYTKRVDMIAGSFVSIRFFAAKENMDVSSLVFLDPPLQEHTLHIMVSRAIEDDEELLADFHEGLEAIREDGTYRRILEEMGYR